MKSTVKIEKSLPPTFLVKFGEKKFLESFRKNGLLYMNSLTHFSRSEKQFKDNPRFDNAEGTDHLLQHDQVSISLKFNGKEYILDKSSGLTKQVRIGSNKDHIKIFCMYAIVADRTKKIIDKKILHLGETAVFITNQNEFIKRIAKKANELQITMESRCVEYVDIDKYHGSYGPFRKPKSYSYQSEYRFVTEHQELEPLKFYIGSIEDISVEIKTDEFIDSFELQLISNDFKPKRDKKLKAKFI